MGLLTKSIRGVLLLAGGWVSLFACATEVGEDILKNGSFEENTTISGSWQEYSEGARTDYWSGHYKLEKAGSPFQGNANLYDGTYAAAFQGGSAYIEQTIDVETEGYYQLAFQFTYRASGSMCVHISVDGVNTGISFLAPTSTSKQEGLLPPFKLTAGERVVRIFVSNRSGGDVTLNLDKLSLKLFGTRYVGSDAMVNGNFESNSYVNGGKQASINGTDARTDGWGGAQLATSSSAYGTSYIVNGSYCVIMQMGSTLTGTVHVASYGRYRLSYYCQNRSGNSSQTLGITIGDVTVREVAAIGNITSRTYVEYPTVELPKGDYCITFRTACSSDHSLFLDDVALICMEEIIDPARIAQIPTIAVADRVYDGADHKPSIAASDKYEITYTPSGDWTTAGVYSVTLSLADKVDGLWPDLTTADITSNMTISVKNVVKPVIETDWLVYTGADLKPSYPASGDYTVTYAPAGAWISVGSEYRVTFALNDKLNLVWADGTTADFGGTFTIDEEERLVVAKPVQQWTTRVATGKDYRPNLNKAGFYTAALSAPNWVAVGEYTATVTLEPKRIWNDGTTDPLVFHYELTSEPDPSTPYVDVLDTDKLVIDTDIIQNGGFESGTVIANNGNWAGIDGVSTRTDAWSGGANLETVTSPVLGDADIVNGKYAAAFHGGGSNWLIQTVHVPVDGFYQLSFRQNRRPYNTGTENWLILLLDGVKSDQRHRVPYSTATSVFAFDPMFMTRGDHELRFQREATGTDTTLNIDDVTLKLKSVGRIGPYTECIVNGNFEATDFPANNSVGYAYFGDGTICRGWSGGGLLLAPNNGYGASSGQGKYCGAIQHDGTIYGEVHVPIKGRYRLSYRYAEREASSSVLHKTTISIGDKVVQDAVALTSGSWTTVTIDDIDLDAGDYVLSVRAERDGSADRTTFYEDFSLVLAEFTDPKPYGEFLGAGLEALAVKGATTNLALDVYYTVDSVGAGSASVRVELVYGVDPEMMNQTLTLAAAATSDGHAAVQLKQLYKMNSYYYLAVRYTADTGEVYVTPTRVIGLPSRLNAPTIFYLQ